MTYLVAALPAIFILAVNVHCNNEFGMKRPSLIQDGTSPRISQLNRFFIDSLKNSESVTELDAADRTANDVLLLRQLLGFSSGILNKPLFARGQQNMYRLRPINKFVSPVILNPNPSNALLSSSSCIGNSQDNDSAGVCVMPLVCRSVGGVVSGQCSSFGKVCCVNSISTCSGTATVNNTYFQSPTTLNTPLSCTLTVKLDARLPEQKFPICQLRLDFVRFTMAQPAPGDLNDDDSQAVATQCLIDNFKVSGTLNAVPVICGNNDGQHMYLHVSPSDEKPTDVKLTFNLGSRLTSSIKPSWKIKVAMLPCGSPSLAAPDCLQYFTSAAGRVASFNWVDASATGASQLASQNYRICFRTEVLENKKSAKKICFSECPILNGGDAFLISTVSGDLGSAKVGTDDCPTDYVRIANGASLLAPADSSSTRTVDRFCGNTLGISGDETEPVTICSDVQPFGLHYFTDNLEDTSEEEKNTGFCLTFQLT